jgi:hypothetical protein
MGTMDGLNGAADSMEYSLVKRRLSIVFLGQNGKDLFKLNCCLLEMVLKYLVDIPGDAIFPHNIFHTCGNLSHGIFFKR